MALSIFHDPAGTSASFKLDGVPALTVALSGITLPGNASSPLHAVPLQQFNNLIVTYGFGTAAPLVIWPPTGYTMANLIGFIPSIHAMYYSGTVNGDDTTICVPNYFSDRIEAHTWNSEQRALALVNYLAIWKK